LRDYFNANLDKDEETLRVNAESSVRAYNRQQVEHGPTFSPLLQVF